MVPVPGLAWWPGAVGDRPQSTPPFARWSTMWNTQIRRGWLLDIPRRQPSRRPADGYRFRFIRDGPVNKYCVMPGITERATHNFTDRPRSPTRRSTRTIYTQYVEQPTASYLCVSRSRSAVPPSTIYFILFYLFIFYILRKNETSGNEVVHVKINKTEYNCTTDGHKKSMSESDKIERSIKLFFSQTTALK